jgi:hypothetical protein
VLGPLLPRRDLSGGRIREQQAPGRSGDRVFLPHRQALLSRD